MWRPMPSLDKYNYIQVDLSLQSDTSLIELKLINRNDVDIRYY